jgi:ligand-binding SRPBCC domain-containing protein
MKVYTLKRTQHLPVGLEEAWHFFSSPKNLTKITPPDLKLTILTQSGGDETYAGQLIRYRVNILPGIAVTWVTEITQVSTPHYFIDRQIVGPYSLWHHQHWFKETPHGVEMTDEVNYSIPFGIMGRLAHWLFVQRRLNAIFDYRNRTLVNLFPQKEITL